jgi:hypothetical protein
VGDAASVIVAGVDIPRRELSLAIAQLHARKARGSGGPREASVAAGATETSRQRRDKRSERKDTPRPSGRRDRTQRRASVKRPGRRRR